jgi:hypothetical protein
MSTKMKLKEQGLTTGVFIFLFSVGFQARFQTAGNLIFKPEENSTLHVTGTKISIQNKKDLIKIMTLMIK